MSTSVIILIILLIAFYILGYDYIFVNKPLISIFFFVISTIMLILVLCIKDDENEHGKLIEYRDTENVEIFKYEDGSEIKLMKKNQ